MAKFRDLIVKNITKETSDTVSVSFEVPQELSDEFYFRPGQYLTFKKEINGVDVRRSYSICTSPKERDLRVAIKKVDGGLFSTFSNEILKEGDILQVMKPMGRFVAETDPSHKKHYVLIASGSGITPILSIAKTVLEDESESEITLIYGNKTFDSIIFREQIEGLKNLYIDRFRINHVLSRENLGNELNNGRIDEKKCELFAKTILDVNSIDECFICGPANMITSVKDWLITKGINEDKIHFELFTAPVKVAEHLTKVEKQTDFEKPLSEQCHVMVIIDDDSIEFDMPMDSDKPILDVAIENGADLPFSCKGGVCCTCRAKVMEGEVAMAVNYALEKDEVEAGFVLTCQSRPKTNNIIIDFDQV